ncbi:UNVERIFIED_ORG: MSHA biogenesis protein MshP [Idiomarina abyssalis]|uniref:Type II secretory pathway component n=1 Tax=Idiomarina sp. 017G TaxID=2183988 RepID=UPI000E0E6D7E|nr:Type II secretory pathway component [Idiomarina sp. 017G]TDO48792.1 MSHA biogenesis protein MshP [Idiomarina sp. 017G]
MHRETFNPIKFSGSQRGSALVVAIFVIVVLGLLVSVLGRLVRTSSESVVVEVLGNRAFFAAETGLQNAMTELFPLNSTIQSCEEVTRTTITLSRGGLKRCEYTVECTDYFYPAAGETHYRIESTGRCDVGNQSASRVLAAEARSMQ